MVTGESCYAFQDQTVINAAYLIIDEHNVSSDTLAKLEIVLNEKFSLIPLKNKHKYFLRSRWMRVCDFVEKIKRNNMYCFMGMDGCGKSTVIKYISNDFSNIMSVRYMGKKDFIFHATEVLISNERTKKLGKIFYFLDLWCRILQSKLIYRKEIIIFDRYAWDNYIFADGTKYLINKIVFKMLFPKPRRIFYLYCSADTSFDRKDDINDKEKFIQNKKKMDSEMEIINNTVFFNTDKLTTDEIGSKIKDVIIKENFTSNLRCLWYK